jgi:hypothetical protein
MIYRLRLVDREAIFEDLRLGFWVMVLDAAGGGRLGWI